MSWEILADQDALDKSAEGLRKRGIEVIIVNTGEEAKSLALEMIPKGAEVMNVTSKTLDQIGLSKELENGNYISVRKKIMDVSDPKERNDLRRKLLAPEYGIGSVQAVTEDGQVLSVSATGSQLPVYAYGAEHVIWIVSTDKIVKNLEDAYKRLYEYILPLESERVRKAYGLPGSAVNKILIFERERPGRIKLIFVKEKLGF